MINPPCLSDCPLTLTPEEAEQKVQSIEREEQLLDLLERWFERQPGGVGSIEEMCSACPELADDLRRQISFHHQIANLLMTDGGPAGGAGCPHCPCESEERASSCCDDAQPGADLRHPVT